MELCGVVNFLAVLLGQGPIITLVVQSLKRVPVIAANPLVAVAVLNALAAVSVGFIWCGLDVSLIITQLIAGFGASVATYETAKTINTRYLGRRRDDIE